MKRRIAVIVIIVVALAILLVPCRIQYKDGGSIEYKAVTYNITKYHRGPINGKYLDGRRIEIFGITLRDDLADIEY